MNEPFNSISVECLHVVPQKSGAARVRDMEGATPAILKEGSFDRLTVQEMVNRMIHAFPAGNRALDGVRSSA